MTGRSIALFIVAAVAEIGVPLIFATRSGDQRLRHQRPAEPRNQETYAQITQAYMRIVRVVLW